MTDNQIEIIRGERIIDYFLSNSGLIKNISRSEIEDLMTMCSCLLENSIADLGTKSKALTVLYDIAFTDNISLEEVWQIYWIISNQLFRNSSLNLIRGNVENLYHYIFEFLQEYLKLDYPYLEINKRNKDVIVVITSQFLGINHAPTRRVLDYSYAIQRELKKKVVIINDAGLNFYRSKFLPNLFIPNYISEYSKINTLPYKDEEFIFYQVDSHMPNINIIVQLLNEIYEINPLFVFNIGASNLVTDLCSNFTTTASLPCSYNIPISRSNYLLVGRKLNNKDAARIAMNQSIIETMMNFNIDECCENYSRGQFGLSENSFVISIVGNRLDDEMALEFLCLLSKVVELPDIHILFIGNINNKALIKEKIDENKIHFAGSIPGASKATKLCNVYLNPKRSGGGRSSFEALYYGVPVVTLEEGDVYYTSGNEFSVSNYSEMYDLLIKHYNDAVFHQEMKMKSINRAKELSNIAETQKIMIDEIIRREEKINR